VHSRQVSDLDAGLEYPGTPAQAAGNVSMPWRADLEDPDALEHGLINPVAWNDASLRRSSRWMAGSAVMHANVCPGIAPVAAVR
jgi:hypothetical protein